MAESRILRNIEAVQRRRNARIPMTLTELFRGDFRALTCVRELDPYAVRKDPEFGPLEPMPGPTELPESPALFAYLGGEVSRSESLVQALALLKQPVFAFLRDDAAAHVAFLESRGVRVFRTAPRLRDVVPKVSCVLSMAGHTTVHAALMGGRSQIALPVHLETDMTTDRLVKMGCAERLSPFGEPHKIAETLDGVLRNQELVDAAQTAAREIAARRTGNGLERIIKACRDSLI
jgi:UDP:flavonoid glycosyltransferase YjiC (YdhE family)